MSEGSIITQFYVAINNFLATFSTKIPRKVRISLLNVAIFVLLWIGFIRYCNKDIRAWLQYDRLFIIGIVTFVLLPIFGTESKIRTKDIRLTPLFWIGWSLCFGAMLISSFLHPVNKDYFVWIITSVFIFPIIFISWSQDCNYSAITKEISKNTVNIAYIAMLMSIALVPFTTKSDYYPGDDYLGLAPNPNNNGIICIAFFGAAFYLLLSEGRMRIKHLICLGVSIAITIISASRAAELAIITEIAVGLAYYVKGCKQTVFKKISCKSVLCAMLLVIVVTICSSYILIKLDTIELNSYALNLSAQEETPVIERINTLSGGRLIIWSEYISQTKFWGNGTPRGLVIDGFDASKWAHNNAIDILYASGVIAFLGYIIWLLSCWFFVFKNLLSDERVKPERLFAMIMFVGYFIEAMLEITLYPMKTNITLLAYLGMPCIACISNNNEETNGH